MVFSQENFGAVGLEPTKTLRLRPVSRFSGDPPRAKKY